MLINLQGPARQVKVRAGFQPHWRTQFIYTCGAGHEVKVFANSFRGPHPVRGVGAIECPQCEFAAKYPPADTGK